MDYTFTGILGIDLITHMYSIMVIPCESTEKNNIFFFISRFGTNICLNEFIPHAHIGGKLINTLLYKKNQFDQVELEKIKSYYSCS